MIIDVASDIRVEVFIDVNANVLVAAMSVLDFAMSPSGTGLNIPFLVFSYLLGPSSLR